MNAFQDTVAINKETILKIARNGETKPQWATKLGIALGRYTSPSYPNGPAFRDEITALRPDWYLATAAINREAILKMARNGGSKPSQKTKLGASLSNYISSSYSNGAAFRAELTAIRPDWFSQVAINKEAILEIARNGGPRPSHKTKQGKALYNYISQSGDSFNQAFRAEITTLRPDWFRK